MKGTIELQRELEKVQKQIAVDKYISDVRKAIEQGRFESTAEAQFIIKSVLPTYSAYIKDYLSESYRGEKEKDKKLLLLMCDNVEVIAVVVLSAILSQVARDSLGLTSVANYISNSLYRVFNFDELTESNPKFINYLGTEFKRASKKRKRQLIDIHIKHLKDFTYTAIDTRAMTRIGATLIDLLVKSGANVVDVYRVVKNGKTQYMVKFTKEAQESIIHVGRSFLGNVNQILNHLPCVVPPKEWRGNDKIGGYYETPIPLVKTKHRLAKKHIEKADFRKIYPIVNKLQNVGWRVNRKVVEFITDIYENNMLDPTNTTKLPKLWCGLPTANVYNVDELITREQFGTVVDGWKLTKEEFHQYYKHRNELIILLDGEMGNRLSLNFALDVATKFWDYDSFYYVQQLDYRGRIYPNATFLSVQQPSYIKAMLEFAEGEYLTDEGVDGLKIHIANCYGYDKAPFKDRIQWFDDNLQEILSVASSPFKMILMIHKADSPFEFYAGCLAYQDYLNGEKVHLPTQWDATCSGIQVYSGILKDTVGATAVNVIGQDRNDIYQIVANKVNTYLEEGDYPNEIEFTDSEKRVRVHSTKEEALSIKGKITRSLVKRNTMTVPYSVTMRGMSDQIREELDDAKFKGKQFWNGDQWIVEKLLTMLNHKAIYDTVNGARIGQEFFKNIVKLLDKPAVWYTPIYNFPVFQPSLKTEKVRVDTLLGELSINIQTNDLSKSRQSNAIAPNIIHSLDSTILYGTVERFDYDIGTIHDCFMVHPNHWKLIKKCYQEAFVELIEANPIEYIGRQIDREGVVPLPMLGELDVTDILKSEYIIS